MNALLNSKIAQVIVRVLAVACAMAVSVRCDAGSNTEQTVSLDQYQVTTWDSRDGTPTDIIAIAQTRDGWLWLGGTTGLFRFDGIRFTKVELNPQGSNRSTAVSALFAMDSGPLLIGRRNGGISVIESGRLKDYPFDPAGESQSGSTVFSFAEDKDGALWAATRTGLVRFDGTKWRSVAADWNLPQAKFECLYVDHAGTLWASTSTEVFRLPRGGRLFQSVGLHVAGFGEFFEAPDGRGWVADNDGARVLPGQVADNRYDPRANSRASMADFFSRDSRFWTTFDWNNRRVGIPRSVPGVEALPGEPHTMLEDRDGNVWVGTAGNLLHRLRRKVVIEIPLAGKPTGRIGLGIGADGIAWFTAFNGSALFREPGEGVFRYDGKVLEGLREPRLAWAITRSANGVVWLAGGTGIWRSEGRALAQVGQLPDSKNASEVRAIAVSPTGRRWVSVLGGGLFEFADGRWKRNGGFTSLPAFEPEALAYDSANKLWLGYRDGRVIVIDGKEARVVAAAQETQLGAVTALSPGPHTLVGGDRGVTMIRNGQSVPLQADDGNAFENVTGIAQTTGGDVWLNCDRGVVRIGAKALDGPVVDGKLHVEITILDLADGYPKGGSISVLSSIAVAPDGKIWMVGTNAIAWVDPKAVDHDSTHPTAFIETIAANGRKNDAASGVALAKGTRDLHFDYTGLDYSHPDRLRFRYRLIGHEKNWVDAGPRRQAFYTNLGPASYRFDVQASNQTGLWSDPASVEFEIPPKFTETLPFVAMCVVAGMISLALLFRIRVRQITAHQEARHSEIAGERERIARELHDTLLQGTQGLILSFQAQARQIDADSPTRAEMERTLLQADEMMAEGRDRIQDLRVPEDTEQDLFSALTAAGEQLKAGRSASCEFVLEGRVRQLNGTVRNEAYRIVREALLNSLNHAKASLIEVQLVYGESVLRVLVRDDGIGIDSKLIQVGSFNHWGLQGMRERAKKVGGNLEIWSRTGVGTEVELVIPAHIAYKHAERRLKPLSRLLLKLLR